MEESVGEFKNALAFVVSPVLTLIQCFQSVL